ncbi:MAG TPA: TfoX/Sxy family protein [Pseudonocardiaceae bacterium]|nr:TfoX/Sxy family protein [Pseudonocardiaceae bacterium]
MAYDHELAEHIRELMAGEEGVTEQSMFGGLGFMLNGNMAVAARSGGGLLVRVDPEAGETLIDGERVRPMVMRGREMAGWLTVDPDSDDEVAQWVARGAAYARSLPRKKK